MEEEIVKEREFEVVDSCLNCEERESGLRYSHNTIICKVDCKPRNVRLKCNLFKKSNDKNILAGVQKILKRNSEVEAMECGVY